MASSSEELIKELKYAAQQKLVNVFLGSGMVGRAVGQRLERKYRENEPLVAKALSEQNDVQGKINTTIVKLEPIVTKIARTVNLIAKVWSKHVFAKQEEIRVRRENLTKERAAAEEDENERKQAEQEAIRKDSLTNLQPVTDTTGKGGILGTLLSDNRNTKSFIKTALSKIGKYLLGATVVGAVGAGVIGAMAIANRQGQTDTMEGEGETSTLPEQGTETLPSTTTPYETPSNVESPTLNNVPSVSATDVGPPETFPQTTSPSTVSGPYEGPLFFQRNIDATAGEGPTTIQAPVGQTPSSLPSVAPAPRPSYTLPTPTAPVPVALPSVSSSSISEVPSTTYQTGDVVNPPAAAESTSIGTSAAPVPASMPQPSSAPGIQNIITNFQQAADNVAGSPSIIRTMDGATSPLTSNLSSSMSDMTGGLSGVSQTPPNVINDMTGFVARNIESGNQLSSLTTLIEAITRGTVESLAPVISTQAGTTDMDSVVEGAAALIPSPIADRGYIDVDTTFESQY